MSETAVGNLKTKGPPGQTWEAGFESGVVVVPVVFSRVEWENGPERYSLLAEAVKSDGVYL